MTDLKQIALFTALVVGSPVLIHAQDEAQDDAKKVTVNGSVQSDILIPQEDEKIGAAKSDHWALTNTYADVNVMSKWVDGGLRFEFNKYPLPGFETDFAGWGVPFIYVKGKIKDKAELTLGGFYEQFGSGFVLRTYEERSLGIDSHLAGARLKVNPVKGVHIKALSGRQRRYWNWNHAWVSGADLELNFEEWLPGLRGSGTFFTLGASMVNKHEKADDDNIMVDDTHHLNLPSNVNAFDLRAQFQKSGFNLLAEYAHKTQDPSFDNGYIYRHGNVAMLSASYSTRGMSFLAQAKRSDNFGFRSRRSMVGASSMINHLPAFTQDQTYALAAMYPYATHPGGEWAYQAQFGYNFKRKTLLGGKYGMLMKVNYSYVHAIDQHDLQLDATGKDLRKGSDGYKSSFWKWGDAKYYQDINVQLERRMSRDFKLSLMYMNQHYNKTIVEGEGGMIRSNIFVADGIYTFSPKLKLRGEVQYLATKDDQGDWVFGLLELSVVPHLMFTVSDMYNSGSTKNHYYLAMITGTMGSHRLSMGYGRTRAGFNCSGGVCRYVPATRGLSVSYNYNF